jgi:hypothetical protein
MLLASVYQKQSLPLTAEREEKNARLFDKRQAYHHSKKPNSSASRAKPASSTSNPSATTADCRWEEESSKFHLFF